MNLTALYLDWTSSDLGSQVRVGRQTRNSQGVLGRFDGALVGWQAKPRLRFNLVGGYPVQSSRQTRVMTERPFYGLAALWIAAAMALLQLLGGVLGLARGREWLAAAVVPAALIQAVFAVIAFALLIAVFVRSDMSVLLVAANSHSLKPMIYKIAGT